MVNFIICEFNPLHNGHRYLIKSAIQKNNANFTVGIMSPNFVQRGEPALFDKWFRAKCAVLQGCDVIFELPTVYALSSAEHFAFGATQIIKLINLEGTLCFGANVTDKNIFKKLLQVDTDFKNEIKTLARKTLSYGRAKSEILTNYCPESKPIFDSPNDILGYEYLSALNGYDKIDFLPIKRNNDFKSASFLRESLDFSDENVPFKELYQSQNKINYKKLYDFAFLKILSKDEDFAQNVCQKRLIRFAKQTDNFQNLLEKTVSKNITYANAKRNAMAIMLDMDLKYVKRKPKYLRVLSFNQKSRKLLSKIDNAVIKPSCLKNDEYFKNEVRTSLIYGALSEKAKPINEFKKSPIFVKDSDIL